MVGWRLGLKDVGGTKGRVVSGWVEVEEGSRQRTYHACSLEGINIWARWA